MAAGQPQPRHHAGMGEPYNLLTSQSLVRLTALSDGVSSPGSTWVSVFVLTLLPFSVALPAHYVHLRRAVGVNWLHILLLGIGLEWSARYAAPRSGPARPARRSRGSTTSGAGS
jgi:hypothetical protein